MRVVDEFVRQEGVQQRFHRRVRRGGVDEVGALQGDHVLVGKFFQLARLEQRAHLHRWQALRLDDPHIPAAALDAQNVPFLADDIGSPRLDRGVAAAVQDKTRFAAQKPGRVDAQRQVAADAFFRIFGDQLFGLAVTP